MGKALQDLKQDYLQLYAGLPAAVTVEDKIIRMIIGNRPVAIRSIPFKNYSDANYYDICRDSMMAENIRYYADSVFPGKKIIVWAHDGHIAKSLFNDHATRSSIGCYLPERLKNQSYFISVKMSEHKGNSSPHIKQSPNHKKSVEASLEKIPAQAFFLDVREGIQSKLLHKKYKSTYWWGIYNYSYNAGYNIADVFDGIIYIRNVHRPVYISKEDIDFYKNKNP